MMFYVRRPKIKPLNTLALDRIFEEYRSSERAFRSAFDAGRRHSDKAMTWVLGPAVLKRIMDVQAIVHQHRGTWA